MRYMEYRVLHTPDAALDTEVGVFGQVDDFALSLARDASCVQRQRPPPASFTQRRFRIGYSEERDGVRERQVAAVLRVP